MKKYIAYIIVFLCGVLVFFLQFGYQKKYQPYTYYQVYLDDEQIGVIKSKDKLEKYISSQGSLIKEQVTNYTIQVERINTVNNVMKNVIKNGNVYYSDYNEIVRLQNIYNNLHLLVNEDGKITGEYTTVFNLYNSLGSAYNTDTSINIEQIVNYDVLKNNIDKAIMDRQKRIVVYLNANKDNFSLTSSEYSHMEDYINDNLDDILYSKYVYMSDFIKSNEIYLHTDDIYEPLGINIKRVNTYDEKYMSVEDAYNKIIEKKPCTIEGFQFRIKKRTGTKLSAFTLVGAQSKIDYKEIIDSSTEDILVYVTDKKLFNEAIDEITAVFIGSEDYEKYKNNNQAAIVDTGVIIDNVYLKEEITIKETNISVKEKIFSDSSSLASYLLYGDKVQTQTVFASSNDTIADLAYKNGISIEEFFLSNPSFTSIDNIFYDGQPITITKLNPQLSLIVEESQVIEQDVDYKVIEKYDNTMNIGEEVVSQQGVKGTMRISQNVQKINGTISYVDPKGQETVKNPVDKVIKVGTKVIPDVGSLNSWGWPTKSGYTISSYFGYRISPITGRRELHSGIDISGTGHGSPIYATNNGVIVTKTYHYSYGNYIIIDHNNGYWSLYAHQSKFAKNLKVGSVVTRGQVIGYIGSTGASTGPHLHFEIRKGKNTYSSVVNPLPYLKK